MDSYGISQALINGNNESQELRVHNENVQEHNENVLKNFNDAESKRKEKNEVDDIWHGVSDPIHSSVALYSAFQSGQGLKNAGFKGMGDYLSNDIRNRMGDIKGGINTIVGTEKEAPSEIKPIQFTGGQSFMGTEEEKLTRLNTLGAGPLSQKVWAEERPSDKQFLINQSQKNLASKPAGTSTAKPLESVAGEEEEGGTTGVGKLAETLATKYGLKGPVAKVVGTTTAKGLGVAGGVISGITDITEKDGTWAKENDFDKTANVLSMVGSGLDAVGTVIPILEPLGLLTSAVGGITGLIGDVIDNTKTHTTNQEALTQGHQDTINQGARASTLTTSGATQKMAQNRQGQASF